MSRIDWNESKRVEFFSIQTENQVLSVIIDINYYVFYYQMKYVRVLIFECKEPSHQAFGLGLAAAGLLALAHVIASLLGGCVCICSQEELQRSSPNKKLSAGSMILSW